MITYNNDGSCGFLIDIELISQTERTSYPLNAGRLQVRRALFQGKSLTRFMQAPKPIAMSIISDNFSMLCHALLVV
jgi:hypothetical protein